MGRGAGEYLAACGEGDGGGGEGDVDGGGGERLKVMVRAYQARTGRLPTRQSDIGPEYARLCNEYNSLKRNHEGLAQAAKRARSAGS